MRCGAVPVACVGCFGRWWLFGRCFCPRLGFVQLVASSVHDVSGLDLSCAVGVRFEGGCVLGNQQCISCVAFLCIVALCSIVGWQCSHYSCFHSRDYVLNVNVDLVVSAWYSCHGCIYTAQARMGAFSCV